MNKQKRGHWGTRLGFILAAAGSAVGLGNLWKFPYKCYENQGGAFFLVYLVAVVLVGFSIMVAEIMLGHYAKRNPIGTFKKLAPRSFWQIIGWLGIITGFIILSYYSVVAGWTIEYTIKSFTTSQYTAFDRQGMEKRIKDRIYKDQLADPQYVKLHVAKRLVYLLEHGATRQTYQELDTMDLQEKEQVWLEFTQAPDFKQQFNDMGTKMHINDLFVKFLKNPYKQVLWHLVFMLATIYIVINGVSHGIERWTTILMPTLFVLLLVLIVFSFVAGAPGKALKFLFVPHFEKLRPISLLEALGQAFFSLSLGMGVMLTYGSYISKKTSLSKSALQICFLDTMVAFMASLIMYPIIFGFNMQPTESIGIIFTTLPYIFLQMPGGAVVAPLFFILVAFAALTSTISLLEVLVSYGVDERDWSRIKSTLLIGGVIFLFGVPCALCNGSIRWVSKIFIFYREGKGLNWFDSMDYLASNWLLPLGGFLIALYVCWVLDKQIKQQMLAFSSKWFFKAWSLVIRYFAPLAVFVILLNTTGVI